MSYIPHKPDTHQKPQTMLLLLGLLLLFPLGLSAQITIDGNVYGGGNQGDVGGSTGVTVYGGDINRVYGGARMANVGGNTFVHLDGEHASSYTVINYVFGGNDVSGTIGGHGAVPDELTQDEANGVSDDNTWSTFVRISSKTENDGTVSSNNPAVFVGQVFGGGNGNYTYSDTPNDDNEYQVFDGTEEVGTSDTPFSKPECAKTYLEILGGTMAYAFGGGNLVTVTEDAVICVDNPSQTVTSIIDAENKHSDSDGEVLTDERVMRNMALNSVTTYPKDPEFQIGSVFGGNNKAPMYIRPTWFLKSGSVRNIYSGGNEGDMHSEVGLLLEIPETSSIKADNVYGGCRKAHVRPLMANGNDTELENVQLPVSEGYRFKEGYSARVLVKGGDINNVYGGNDITGDVYGGSAVGIYTSIRGNVYGGGNGSYAYTDNDQLKSDVTWGDFYYDPISILGIDEGDGFSPLQSAQALNKFRPHAERVIVRLWGADAANPTIIGGSVYVGGNSASLRNDRTQATAYGELKIGSNVYADKVFLGNNGENMVDASEDGILARYAGNVTIDDSDYDFSQMDLKQADVFAEYMDGCTMSIRPKVSFDKRLTDDTGDPDTYTDYSSYFGSFFCGGNVGSVSWPGRVKLDIDYNITLFDRFVGGCNKANVDASPYNAEFLGGVLGSKEEQEEGGMEYTDEDGITKIKDRMEINLSGLKMLPQRWVDPDDKSQLLTWNIYDQNNPDVNVDLSSFTGDSSDLRLRGANVYGGCYISGHTNGNVIINIEDDTTERENVFGASGSGVVLEAQSMDPFGSALNVYGGGYGQDTEIWGSATVNLIRGYTFQIFGGGEMGAVGKGSRSGTAGNYTYTYAYDPNYSTYVNLSGNVAGTDEEDVEDLAEAEFLYGGGFEGPVAGNTVVHLDNGRIFNSFGGSCNADIEGHAETYVGLNGFPYVREHLYGGNDLGGSIKGEADFSESIRSDIREKVYNKAEGTTTNASAYVEYRKGHIVNLFGGCYGDYDYYDKYAAYSTPRLGNAFVHFRPESSSSSLNGVVEVFGSGEGGTQVKDRDSMQVRSYVLVDIPQNMTTFQNMSVFGGGSFSGLGMGKSPADALAAPNTVSAVIDLFRGQIKNAYGGSYQEGITRRSVVNVPTGSTIFLNNVFGGAYGINNLLPCDVYESNVNFNSGDAQVSGGVYGGNNHARRTLYTNVNINATVWSNKASGYQGYVYGAGLGVDTWAQYTDVTIGNGGIVYKVFGGGDAGQVLNLASVNAMKEKLAADGGGTMDLSLGTGYTDNGLNNDLAKYSTLADDVYDGIARDAYHTKGEEKEKYNTNVHIIPGGLVTGYAYGAGYGESAVVSGTTYIDVLGGTVDRDVYAGGQGGSVRNLYSASADFTATANAYVKGGSVRNVYGGGYLGAVGYHDFSTTALTNDVLAETNVVIGATPATGAGFANGIPAVMRNAYGGGEGGSVYGTTHLTINDGFVGYRYDGTNYIEELDDPGLGEQSATNALVGAGNAFGGGYIANSYADITNVYMYGGTLRGSMFGGGEIGPIGRGTKKDASGNEIDMPVIHKGGATHVYLYGGHVVRDVFGGGRGYDSWGGDGTKFMSDEQIAASDFFTKGFVFGSTDVCIRGGEIGTEENVGEDGYGNGNVFGGGDIGYVYSATGQKASDGYYHVGGSTDNPMTVDCSVDVAPYCKVTASAGITIGSKTYHKGDYIPKEDLDKLPDRRSNLATWNKFEDKGIIIRNAIFAGGNVSVGSDQIFVNTNTVYGNATAALRDLYNCDYITVGKEHIGGLYGDGNLTFVDGFRELHISNYGTDALNVSGVEGGQITGAEYNDLTEREKVYYELRYECTVEYTSSNGKYEVGSQLSAADYESLVAGTAYESNWSACARKIHSGRPLNTIQRADFVGVYGSRIVLFGARDRVPEKADYTNYTINRVGELSLNAPKSPTTGQKDTKHVNYFGIHSIVNYLGNLTSDCFFTDVRKTESDKEENQPTSSNQTFHDWKVLRKGESNRNNGYSWNQVSLANGVHLDITREEGESTGQTEWGYITGVVQLELLNVMPGFGGGYVYAKNEHRKASYDASITNVTVSPYNTDAQTYKRYIYDAIDDAERGIETSGNFVHSVKPILDDCFPIHNNYKGSDPSPAHYWYIKGSIYVYDQYISAYTGSASPYSQNISIPLTISAQSHGRLLLREIQPNLYAYYDQNNARLGDSGAETTIVANGITYSLNDPITYWDWYQLSDAEKLRFVPETYTVVSECKIGSKTYPKGYTMLPAEYASLSDDNTEVYDVVKEKNVPFTDVFRLSNNLSHDTGYALTYDITNPMVWDNWYTNNTDMSQSARLNTEQYNPATMSSAYTEGPTYYATANGVYGQKDYSVGDIIANDIYDTYQDICTNHSDALPGGQADFEDAYVATQTINVSGHSINVGTAIAKSDYTDQWDEISSKVALAYVVTSTLKLAETEYLYAGDLMSAADVQNTKNTYPELASSIDEHVAKAYYCTSEGRYGGNYFETGKPYTALNTWCTMSEADRSHFSFNYDALDVLIDPTYGQPVGEKYQYDGTNDPRIYSVKTPVDYTAICLSSLEYTNAAGSRVNYAAGTTLTREQYESVPNEKYHYSPVVVTNPGNYYIVKESFVLGDEPYAVGEVVSSAFYGKLNGQQQSRYIDIINFTEPDYTGASHIEEIDGEEVTVYEPVTYYYCRDPYYVNENGEGEAVTDIFDNTKEYDAGAQVPMGTVISKEDYDGLPNLTISGDQLVFEIVGNTPIETSTLYVSRESDIFDLSKEKIITVAYMYEYEESDASGTHIMPMSERHIVNIHLMFKSGVPEIGPISKPATVLPSSTVGLKVPSVTPGAYEVLSSGWEYFTNETDANNHKNGLPYINNTTPMYWYQNGYYVAYYAKTYLGKTYSNSVPFSIANYHDLDRVMQDTEHHMYVDHEDVQRDPKIYIDNRACASDPSKNELDLLKDFFELTLQTRTYDQNGNPETISGGVLDGHVGVNTNQIGASKNLDFILRSDMSPMAYTEWTPIGTDEHCFEGTLHADGYTISGLDKSLFHKLCGEVYNLGVTGSFTGAGIVDEGSGYVENCWVMSSAENVDGTVNAVFGNPTDTEGQQVVNCYYPETNAYSEAVSERGNARKMPLQSFYNGEVTYDLNGFYLYKRYADHELTAGTKYNYYSINAADGTLTAEESYYAPEYAFYPLKPTAAKIYGYVEDRYADGDFIYAGGSIPDNKDVRYKEENGVESYYPIWPDDYLFFGQRLTYGHVDGRPHQDMPAHINKSGTRLTTVSANINRVYRAPAYFRSKEMSMAHYNPYAVFAQTKKDDADMLAYKDMTAIDFTGADDVFDVDDGTAKPYKRGLEGSLFYPPMLDNDGLEYLRNVDLTKNWLVYTPAATSNAEDADSKTYEVVTDYLSDAAYAETNTTYHTVARVDASGIHGHAVVKQGTAYKAQNDHFLVDKNDFNAPIEYTFASGQRMWYQRLPERYAGQKRDKDADNNVVFDTDAGWEGISLPFDVDIVTTQQKGELTHFYQDNTIGHEYWLRSYADMANVPGEDNKLEALFVYPDKQLDHDKEYDNIFLWDYYYSEDQQKDKNEDIYKTYYKTSHTYSDYPQQQSGVPYIIGFPGERYYEFDLSGAFKPENTYSDNIARLAAQTVTFASTTGVTINVSDEEATDVTYHNYTFKPTYMKQALAAGTNAYVLSYDGDCYEKVPTSGDAVEVLPFRPYFMQTPGAPGGLRHNARAIVFSREFSQMGGQEEDDITATGQLIVTTKRGKIVVISSLQEAKDIRIVNAAGMTIDNYVIQPGETVETSIHTPGVYIVNKKKLSVR